jgi:uncharacterized protein YukE
MPLPGDPEAVLDASRDLRTAAEALARAHESVTARTRSMSGWQGAAAAAATSAIDGRSRTLQQAAECLAASVGPLLAYADELRAAQLDYARGEATDEQGRAALAAAGSGTVPAADAARDAANQTRDDAADLLIAAEARALHANETAARALAAARAALDGLSPPSTPGPVVGDDRPDIGSALADVGNGLASFGNAAVHDVGSVSTMAAGAGLVALGAAGDLGGLALIASAVGAPAGAAVAAGSTALIGVGAGLVGVGALTVAQDAQGSDRVEPFRPGGSGPAEVPPAQRPSVEDPKLNNILDDLYRATRSPTRTGDGTTADAVRSERETGDTVGDKFHTQKANDYVRALRRWLRRNPDAPSEERQVAQHEYDNLLQALGRTQ